MTALAANKDLDQKDGKLVAFPVVASDILYKGALVKINAAGFLAPCAAEAGAQFAGVAYEQIDNSAGAAGAKTCRVETEGVFEMLGAGLAQADVGSSVYASDDQTVSTTQAANEQLVGKIVEFVSATKVMVKINNATF